MWITNEIAVQGRSHIADSIPCQDKTYTISKNETTAIALADGAGSAKLSHFGAEACVKSISDFYISNFDEIYESKDRSVIKQKIQEKLFCILDELTSVYHCERKDLACTLLCVVIKDNRMLSFHLGDGIIACLRGDELCILSEPDNGEFANITYFVTSATALEHMRINSFDVSDINGFFLMSDGAGDSLYNPQHKILSNAIKKIASMSLIYSSNEVHEQLKDFFENGVRLRTKDDCSIAYMIQYQPLASTLKTIPCQQQLDILRISDDSSVLCKRQCYKRYSRYMILLEFLEHERPIKAIAKRIGLRPKHCRKHLKFLIETGLIRRGQNGRYVNSNVIDTHKVDI